MKKSYRFIFITFSIVIISVLITINTSPQTVVSILPETPREKELLTTIETDKGFNEYGIFCSEASTHSPNSDQFTNEGQDKWKLVWQDEFDYNCLDPSKWNAENWAAEKNNELQYYTPDNLDLKSGVLQIISKKEKYRGRDYTSGAIHSQGKFDFLYGKAEIRAKLPAGQGIFPAFWMMANNQDDWLPEIDIMEMLGHRPDEIWMVSHWLDQNGNLKSVSDFYKGEDFSKAFHTFSVEWTPDSITWFIDGVERFSTTSSIPNEKMYLYLNTAVGGNWPGSPDEATTFPVHYEVDYVRVYKSLFHD